MPKLNSAWQTHDGTSRVLFTLYFPRNGVQTGYNMETDMQTNPCIPDTRWSGICQQTEILVPHGSWFWVFCTLYLSGGGWSRLPWGVLPAMLGVTIPGGSASADSLSTGGAGVKCCCSQLPPWVHPSYPTLCWS